MDNGNNRYNKTDPECLSRRGDQPPPGNQWPKSAQPGPATEGGAQPAESLAEEEPQLPTGPRDQSGNKGPFR